MRHLVICIVLFVAGSNANAAEFTIGAHGGTPGIGLNATLGIA